MADHYHVHPHELMAASTQFGSAAGDLDSALQALTSSLGDCGTSVAMIGDDKPGTQFAAAYNPKVETLKNAITKHVEVLHGIERGVHNMAETYQGSDSAHEVSFQVT